MSEAITNEQRSRADKSLCGYAGMPDDEYNRRWFARMRARTLINERGCFIWTGPQSTKGYPMHPHRSHHTMGHRIAYILTYGIELTREQFVCHRCDERRCWNPEHMFIGSTAENQQDSIAKRRQRNTKKTHCWRGHPFSGTNLELVKGGRRCAACMLGNSRIRAGWPEDLAYSLPPQKLGYHPPRMERVVYKTRPLSKEKRREVLAVIPPTESGPFVSMPASRFVPGQCLRGHDVTGDNLYVSPTGDRACKKCNTIRAREYQQRKRAQKEGDAHG